MPAAADDAADTAAAEGLLALVTGATFAKDLASAAQRKAFLDQVRGISSSRSGNKRAVQVLLKCAQGCLQSLAAVPTTTTIKDDEDAPVRPVLYEATSLLVHALAACVPPDGKLGFERILYHTIARGAELQQHADVQALTRLLAGRIRQLVRGDSSGAKKEAEEGGMVVRGGDDWGAEAGGREPLSTASNKSSSKGRAGSGGQKKKAAKEEEEEDKAPAAAPGGFGFGQPTATCGPTLVRLVCGAAVNGLRALVEGPLDAAALPTLVEGVVQECMAWVGVLAKGNLPEARDREMASEYAERLYRTVWKAAAVLEEKDASLPHDAMRLRALCVDVSLEVGTPTLAHVVQQLWRVGIQWEKKAAAGGGKSAQLLSTVVYMYEDAARRLLLRSAKGEWALCVEVLDWFRHYVALCLKLKQPTRALVLLTQASEACQGSNSLRVQLAHATLLLQTATIHLSSSSLDLALTALAKTLPMSSDDKKKAKKEEEEKAAVGTRRPHLIRLWRALARLSAVLPVSSSSSSSFSSPSVALQGFLALAHVTRLLLSSSPPPASSPPSSELPEATLKTTLTEALSRAALLLTLIWVGVGEKKGAPPPLPPLPAWLGKEAEPVLLCMACLAQAEENSSGSSSNTRRKLGTAWFSLGRALASPSSSSSSEDRRRRRLLGLGPLARGCRMLEEEGKEEKEEERRQLQLDMRLATLATALGEAGVGGVAGRVVTHTLGMLAAQAVASSSSSSSFYPPSPALMRKLVRCRLGPRTLDEKGLAAALKKAGAPSWCLDAVVGGGWKEEEEEGNSSVLCLSLPSSSSSSSFVWEATAKAEMSAYVSLVHAALKDHPEKEEEKEGEVAARAFKAHGCCRRCGLVSPLYAVVEGARMARVVARAPEERRKQLLKKEEEEELGGWVDLLGQELLASRGGKQTAKVVYEVALGECMRGLLWLEVGKGKEAAAAMGRSLESWRQLLRMEEEEEMRKVMDPSLTRQCITALIDHVGGDGPSLRQAQLLETAAWVSGKGYLGGEGRKKEEEEEKGGFLAWILSLFLTLLELPDLAQAYHAQAQQQSISSHPLLETARLLASSSSSSSSTPFSSSDPPPRDVAGSLLHSLACLLEIDEALAAGDLTLALGKLRRLTAVCQGLPPPPLEPTAAEAEGEEEEEEEMPVSQGQEEEEEAVPMEEEEEVAPPPSHGDPLLPPVVVGGWRQSWCLAECLVRMGEVWETLGVEDKASSYYKKALLVAQRWGAGGVARRAARGRARVKGEEEEQEEEGEEVSSKHLDDLIEEVEALLRRGDRQRRSRAFQEAVETYAQAQSLHGEAAAVEAADLLLLPPAVVGKKKKEGTVARYQTVGAALGWRQGWTRWLLDSSKKTNGKASSSSSSSSSCVEELRAVVREDSTAPALEKAEAWLRLARVGTQSDDTNHAQEELEQAWMLAQRTRCPRLIRDAGRSSFLTMAAAAAGAVDEAAVWRLAHTVGIGFGNAARLSAASGTREVLNKVLPAEWSIVTLALMPPDEVGGGGGLLVGRIEGGGKGGMRMLGAVVGKAEGVQEVLAEMEKVMDGNTKTLHGRTAEEVAGWGKKEKAAWWQERESLDARLGALLKDLQALLGPWRWLLCGQLDERQESPLVAAVDAALEALGVEEEEEGDAVVLVRAALVGMVGTHPMLDQEAQQVELGKVLEAVGLVRTPAQVDAALGCLAVAVAAAVSAPPPPRPSTAGAGKAKKTRPTSKSTSSTDDAVDALCQDLSLLTVADLKKELAAQSLPTTGVKATLVARLEDSRRQSGKSSSSSSRRSHDDDTEMVRRDAGPPPVPESLDALFATRSSSASSSSSRASAVEKKEGRPRQPRRESVLLVLDETLQRLPWESLPLLKDHPVSRCPSLQYIETALRVHAPPPPPSTKKAPKGGKKKKEEDQGLNHPSPPPCPLGPGGVLHVPRAPGFYVLDPEANLATTRGTLQPVLAALHDQSQGLWESVVGEAPTEDWLKAQLVSKAAFIYCGHGSGELFLAREHVAALGQAPLAILMGCSSGRLRTPQGSNVSPELYEPTGMVLSYLAAGSPAVVCNLWDVTDKDIDRFSLALLADLFSEKEEDQEKEEAGDRALVLPAVARARTACKLAYLVGAAPVVYGLPVRMMDGCT